MDIFLLFEKKHFFNFFLKKAIDGVLGFAYKGSSRRRGYKRDRGVEESSLKS